MTTTDSTPDARPDAIVIGSGSGGLTVAVGLSQFGKQVMMIEGHQVGGDCTNVGCIPSKSLLHHAAELESAGVPGDDATAAVLATVRAARDHLREEETEHFSSVDGIDLRFGRARLLGSGRVEITAADGTATIAEADHIVLATGSHARRLPIGGLPAERLVTNEELFEQHDVPKRMVIVGAGPIGLEMAVAFRRLGSEIVVLDAEPQILPALLPEAAAVLSASLTEQGIDLRPGLVAKGFDEATRTLAIGPLDGDATDTIADVDRVLMAVGRVPNSDGIGLDVAGVELDRGRVVVDDKGRTNVDGIWATGDVTTEGGTTHLANVWGRRIIKHVLAPFVPAGDRPVAPAVTFTDPEAASIGEQPIVAPDDVRRLTLDLSTVDRGYVDKVEHGIIIVDIRRFTGEILGATIVGPRAGELISTFSLAMKTGIKFHSWYGTVWPYPSYSDALGKLVDAYMGESLPQIHKEALAWGKGLIARRRSR